MELFFIILLCFFSYFQSKFNSLCARAPSPGNDGKYHILCVHPRILYT